MNHEKLQVYTIVLRSNTDFSVYPSMDSHQALEGPEDPPCYREQAVRRDFPILGDKTRIRQFRAGSPVKENDVVHLPLLAVGTPLLAEFLQDCEFIISIQPISPGRFFPGSCYLYHVVESGFRPVRGSIAQEILSGNADTLIEGELEQYLFEPVCQRLQSRIDENASEACWTFRHWNETLSAAASILSHADLASLDHNDLDPLADLVWKEIKLTKNSKEATL